MPGNDKWLKNQVTFALAIVKGSVLADRAESAKIDAALKLIFPGVSIILVDEGDESAVYQHHNDLGEFIDNASCRVIASSKISPN